MWITLNLRQSICKIQTFIYDRIRISEPLILLTFAPYGAVQGVELLSSIGSGKNRKDREEWLQPGETNKCRDWGEMLRNETLEQKGCMYQVENLW